MEARARSRRRKRNLRSLGTVASMEGTSSAINYTATRISWAGLTWSMASLRAACDFSQAEMRIFGGQEKKKHAPTEQGYRLSGRGEKDVGGRPPVSGAVKVVVGKEK